MEILGCKTVAELNKVDVEKLMEASGALLLRMFPERDGKILSKNPYEAYEGGIAKNIEFLQGCNKDEMNFFVASFGIEDFMDWAVVQKANLLCRMDDKEKALIESYFKDIKGENYEPYSALISQRWFNAPLIRLSECQTKAGGKSYTYYFKVESLLPILKSGHSLELPSVFNHPDMDLEMGRVLDKNFSRTMRRLWVQFAKTGNPSLAADASPDGKAKEWPPYDLKDKKVMVLDEFDIHPDKEKEQKIVDWDRTYFLTKYY